MMPTVIAVRRTARRCCACRSAADNRRVTAGSEALLSRVEDKVENAANRMNESARQSDLAALRTEMRGLAERTRRLPGTGALVLTAVITAILTVVLMVAVQRLNLDRLLPQRATIGTTAQ